MTLNSANDNELTQSCSSKVAAELWFEPRAVGALGH